MSNLIITSKFKTSNRIFYLFGILFFSFLSFLSFSKYTPNNFITYPNLAAGSCFIFFAVFILYSILTLPKINIYSDKIEFHRFFGLIKRALFLNEINSWVVRKKESKYGNYEYLYLTTNQNKTIKLSSYESVSYTHLTLPTIYSV